MAHLRTGLDRLVNYRRIIVYRRPTSRIINLRKRVIPRYIPLYTENRGGETDGRKTPSEFSGVPINKTQTYQRQCIPVGMSLNNPDMPVFKNRLSPTQFRRFIGFSIGY